MGSMRELGIILTRFATIPLLFIGAILYIIHKKT